MSLCRVINYSEPCPVCASVGADVLKQSPHGDMVLQHLVCRECGTDWFYGEPITDATTPAAATSE